MVFERLQCRKGGGRRYEPPTISPPVHWSCHHPDFSKWPPFILLMRQLFLKRWLSSRTPRGDIFSTPLTLQIASEWCFLGCEIGSNLHYFRVISAGRPNEVKRPEVTPRNILWSEHLKWEPLVLKAFVSCFVNMAIQSSQSQLIHSCINQISLFRKWNLTVGGQAPTHMTKIEK